MPKWPAARNAARAYGFRSGDSEFETGETAISASVAALRRGAILAVKGVGGYHLMCDACDNAAVLRLRAMKRRPTKPLAVIVPAGGADDLDMVRMICAPKDEEARSLRSVERPIVLMTLRPGGTLAAALAPGLPELGVMLPYSPLHTFSRPRSVARSSRPPAISVASQS